MEAHSALELTSYPIFEAATQENISRDLIEQARKFYLPTPSMGEEDKWVDQEEFGDAYHFRHWRVLTPEAFNELRAAIRKEKRQRREVWESWIKVLVAVVTILTGLVGAAIGLASVLKK